MKYFFSILFFAAPLFLQGQEIKVNVVFKNEPLPYSYVSVNGTPIDIANTSGIARIPVNKLNLGDTITSSMLGLLPVSLIYDQQIQQNQSCELVHTTEDVYDLSEVVTTGYGSKSSRKIFRNVVKTHPRLTQNCFVSGNFTSIVILADGVSHPVNGSFVLENNIPKKTSNKDIYRFYFNILPQIETGSDTTNLSRELLPSIRYIYREICGVIGLLHIEHIVQQQHSSMSYIGLRAGRHFFSYRNFDPDPRIMGVIQILFETDADSQELINVKYTTFNLGDNHFNYTINVSCEKLSNAPPKSRATITVPKNIEANIIRPDGSTIDLKIFDTSIKFQ